MSHGNGNNVLVCIMEIATTYVCHGNCNNVVYKSRKCQHLMCMCHGNDKWRLCVMEIARTYYTCRGNGNNVLVRITETARTYICHGNGNKWRVCVTKTTAMYLFASRKCWIHLVWEASAGVLKIIIIVWKKYVDNSVGATQKNFKARRIQKFSNVYPTAALSTVNTAGNDLRLYPTLSQKTSANLCLRRDVA